MGGVGGRRRCIGEALLVRGCVGCGGASTHSSLDLLESVGGVGVRGQRELLG